MSEVWWFSSCGASARITRFSTPQSSGIAPGEKTPASAMIWCPSSLRSGIAATVQSATTGIWQESR